MRLELALCLRYLRSRQREGSLSLITMVAVVGVTLGVAALVVALSLMNGYQVNMVRAMAGALPHVSISPTRSEGFENLRQVEDLVQKELSPVSISPFVLREVMVSNPRAPGAPVQGVVLRGVEPTRESTSAEFLALLHDDSPGWDKAPKEIRLERAKKVLKALESSKGEGDPVLLSPMLARRLGVKAGDTLIPLRFPKEGGSFSPTPMPVKLLVAGFFETGIPTFDEMVVLMDIGRIGPVFHLKPGDLSLGIRLTDPMLAGESVEKLRFVYPGDGNGFSVFSWLDSNKGLFKVIQTQKVMLGLVLMLIVVIAFFGMVSAMVMLVIDKTREISALKALGVTPGFIRRVFFLQGVFIGGTGLTAGLVVGLLICWGLDSFAVIEIPAGVYPGSNRVPVHVFVSDLIWVALATTAVSMVSTLYPASKAMRLSVIQGLRED